jgi:hypothetical protein
MPQEVKIKDLDIYTSRMAKSMIDKIYFMDKVDATVFVDYGCADASLILTLARLFPDFTFIGYDISSEMIASAKKNCASVKANTFFTTKWEEAVAYAKSKSKGKAKDRCLIISSVIHEVYSYSDEAGINEFWSRVWSDDFGHVAIRDMMVSETTSRPSDPLIVARIKQLDKPYKIKDWESQWGSLNENWSLVHYLLTYKYEENWEREYRENYLPISLERFMKMIPRKYVPEYIEHFTLPYLRQVVLTDFGIQLQDRTHLKIILKKEM